MQQMYLRPSVRPYGHVCGQAQQLTKTKQKPGVQSGSVFYILLFKGGIIQLVIDRYLGPDLLKVCVYKNVQT